MAGSLCAEVQGAVGLKHILAAKGVQNTDFLSQEPKSRKQFVTYIVFIRLLKEALKRQHITISFTQSIIVSVCFLLKWHLLN